ncbi:MAG TPA: hypothetical protein VM364_18545 [Vicinamibacterales bacterium]|nr:hypothetical protein [Vicinamibacterales bacterium]
MRGQRRLRDHDSREQLVVSSRALELVSSTHRLEHDPAVQYSIQHRTSGLHVLPEQLPPLGQTVLDLAARGHRDGTRSRLLVGNLDLARFQLPEFTDQRGEVTTGGNRIGQAGNLPLDLLQLHLQRPGHRRAYVPLGRRHDRLHRLRPQGVLLDSRQHRLVHILNRDTQRIRAGFLAGRATTSTHVVRHARLLLRVHVSLNDEATAAYGALRQSREQVRHGTLRRAAANLPAQLPILESHGLFLDQLAPLGDRVPQLIGDDPPVRFLDALPVGLGARALVLLAVLVALLRAVPHVDATIILAAENRADRRRRPAAIRVQPGPVLPRKRLGSGDSLCRQSNRNTALSQAGGIHLKDPHDGCRLVGHNLAVHVETTRTAVLVHAVAYIDVPVSEHAPADDVPPRVLRRCAFVVPAARIFSVRFVAEGPQRRHRLLQRVPRRQGPLVHIGPDLHAVLGQFFQQGANGDHLAAQRLLLRDDDHPELATPRSSTQRRQSRPTLKLRAGDTVVHEQVVPRDGPAARLGELPRQLLLPPYAFALLAAGLFRRTAAVDCSPHRPSSFINSAISTRPVSPFAFSITAHRPFVATSITSSPR